MKNYFDKFSLRAIKFKNVLWGKISRRLKFDYYIWACVGIAFCLIFAFISVYIIYILRTEEIQRKPEVIRRERVKLAIILDDAGGNTVDYNEIFSIGAPITLSVLPNLPTSKWVAGLARNHGLEVILHLPMEPENTKYAREDGEMVLTAMSEGEIKRVVEKDLESIGIAEGLNNHMGSKAVRDERVMKAVLKVAAEKNLYFIDSKTTRDSIAFKIAKKLKIPSVVNSSFLDVGTTKKDIEVKFKELVSKARKEGYAVGIGHATRKMTIEVLKELIPEYKERGIEFVYAGEVVR